MQDEVCRAVVRDRETKGGAHKFGSGNSSAINVQSCETSILHKDKRPAGASSTP